MNQDSINKFEEIYNRQKRFEYHFFDADEMSDDEKIIWTKEFIFCLHQELSEVMQTIPWKTYHTNDKKYSIKDTQTELIDCFKFLLNLMIIWNMEPKKIYELFNEKSNIVEKRHSNE